MRNMPTMPFSETIYPLAAALDPRFILHWVDIDVRVDSDFDSTERLHSYVKDYIKGKSTLLCCKKVIMMVFS